LIITIGDIHGCFDPLKALMRNLEHLSKYFKVEYIFLGDYIDRGPSTKAVLDYLIALKENANFLMGNHEQMLMMYHRGHELFDRIGNAWFAKNNGGLTTVEDLDPDSTLFKDVWEEVSSGNNSYKYKKNNGEFKFDGKYEAFFDNMKFAIKREIKIKNHNFNILFSHAIPNNLIPIDEILECESYETFCEINKKYDISEERSNLWNKEFLIEPVDNCTVIHGHIPTFKLTDYVKSSIGLLETNFDKELPNQAIFVKNKETNKILQIDMDTGSVYGGRLSALLIPENDKEAESISKHRFSSDLSLLYVDSSKGFYQDLRQEQENLPGIHFFDHNQ
jgi:serine/threonine protein phosphatase 1